MELRDREFEIREQQNREREIQEKAEREMQERAAREGRENAERERARIQMERDQEKK